MNNSVSIGKKTVIEQVYEGDQTHDAIRQLTLELTEICSKLRGKKKEVKILADLTKIGNTTTGSRRALVESLEDVDYDKVALFGGGTYIKHLANFIIQASGRLKKVKVFNTRKEALKWLKEKQL
jgi:UDP-N-acetylmuramyl pentapeptide synthase